MFFVVCVSFHIFTDTEQGLCLPSYTDFITHFPPLMTEIPKALFIPCLLLSKTWSYSEINLIRFI